MVDASELPWRLLSRKYGAQVAYTPMFNAGIFIRETRYRREALESCPEDRPLIVQVSKLIEAIPKRDKTKILISINSFAPTTLTFF